MITNEREEIFNQLYKKYESRKKPVSVGASCFKEEYYNYILRHYKKGKDNFTLSISEYYNDLFFIHFSMNTPLKRTDFIKEIMEFGEHLLEDCPKKPIFDDRSEFVMFFLRYYYLMSNKRGIPLETEEYIIIDNVKYKKNGVA